jgi:hypothetical protein
VDVWFVDDPDRQHDLAHVRDLPKRLTAETRAAILGVKEAWHRRDDLRYFCMLTWPSGFLECVPAPAKLAGGPVQFCCFPSYVCDERRWLIARPITSFRSAASVMPSKPKPK